MGPGLLLRPDVYRGVERRKCTDGGVEIQKSLVSSNGMKQNVTVAFLIGRILWGIVAVIWFVQNEIIHPCFDSSVVVNHWTRLTIVLITLLRSGLETHKQHCWLAFGAALFDFWIYSEYVGHPLIQSHCNIYILGVSDDGKPHGKKYAWFFMNNYFVNLFCKPLSTKSAVYFSNLLHFSHSVVTHFIISIISWVKSYKFQ